ncbi:MAG: chitobiase/beta-hexosaminidase C-terminal domain-containing protein, partial [Verrucomicrobiota bacterium]
MRTGVQWIIFLSLMGCGLCSGQVVISEFMASNDGAFVGADGITPDWIELHNRGEDEVDLKGYFLTDSEKNLTKWSFPAVVVKPGGYVLVFATGEKKKKGRNRELPRPEEVQPVPPDRVDRLGQQGQLPPKGDLRPRERRRGVVLPPKRWNQARRNRSNQRVPFASRLIADFKLEKNGEFLALVKPDGTTVVHSVGTAYPPQRGNVSFGLGGHGQNSDGWRFFKAPTPGGPNGIGLLGFVEPVAVDQPRGLYAQPVQVRLSSPTKGAAIYYTTDGSIPDARSGQIYEGPLTIARTTVLRASATLSEWAASKPATTTYLFPGDVVRQGQGRDEAPEGWPDEWVNDQRLDYGMDPDIVGGEHTEEEVVASLKALPSVSLVLPIEEFLGEDRGIYVNARQKGVAWERETSMELIEPGKPGFQIDGGMRVRGGFSRQGRNPKHCVRFIFRKRYGSGKLKYPLFEDEGAEVFDHIDLRSSMNHSWALDGSKGNTLLRDVFSRDAQGELGHPYTRSRFYHLYINGQYWGVYMTQERAEASFAATYMGGEEEDFDVIKTFGEVSEGESTAYRELYDMTVQGLEDPALYFKAQGLKPDGTPDPEGRKLL